MLLHNIFQITTSRNVKSINFSGLPWISYCPGKVFSLTWVSSEVSWAGPWALANSPLLGKDIFSLLFFMHSVHWQQLKRCHCSEIKNVTLFLSKSVWFYSMAVAGFEMVLICFAFFMLFFISWKQGFFVCVFLSVMSTASLLNSSSFPSNPTGQSYIGNQRPTLAHFGTHCLQRGSGICLTND